MWSECHSIKRLLNISICFLFSSFVEAEALFDIVVIDPISADPIVHGLSPKKPFSDSVDLTLALNDYEPASFVFVNVKNKIEHVSVKVTDLVNGDNRIPADVIDIKLVKSWFQAPGAWKSHRVIRGSVPKLVPELLVNDLALVLVDEEKQKNYLRVNGVYKDISVREKNTKPALWDSSNYFVSDAAELQEFSLKKGKPQQIWLTVHLGTVVPPGQYTGTILIQISGNTLKKIPLNVKVLPFELEAPLIEYSIYYRGRYHPNYGTVSSEYKNENQLRVDFEDMKAHGICCPTVYQRIKVKHSFEKVKGKTQKELLQEYMRIRSEVGLEQASIYYIGLLANDKVDSTLLPYFEQVATVMRESGVQSIYFYGEDEAKKGGLTKQLQNWSILKDLGYKIFAAGSQGHSTYSRGMTDLLVLQGKYNTQEKNIVRKLGGKIFVYSNPQVGLENPLVYRENYGYLLWLSGYDGAMDYAYQHSMGSIWNDFDHPIYRDLVFSYPTSTGTINTIAWEGFREAIDDVRYLTTLAMRSNVGRSNLRAWGDAYLNELALSGITSGKEIRQKIIADLLSYESLQ